MPETRARCKRKAFDESINVSPLPVTCIQNRTAKVPKISQKSRIEDTVHSAVVDLANIGDKNTDEISGSLHKDEVVIIGDEENGSIGEAMKTPRINQSHGLRHSYSEIFEIGTNGRCEDVIDLTGLPSVKYDSRIQPNRTQCGSITKKRKSRQRNGVVTIADSVQIINSGCDTGVLDLTQTTPIAAESSVPWYCSFCTVRNDHGTSVCSVCQREKGQMLRTNSSKYWFCRFCSYRNLEDCFVCQMCRHSLDEKPQQRDNVSCAICFDEDLKLSELVEIGMCGHTMCKTCAQTLVDTEMKSGNVPVCCPVCKMAKCAKCMQRNPPPQDEEQQDRAAIETGCCIFQQAEIKQLINHEEFQRYLNIEAKKCYKQMDYFECPGKDCGGVYEIVDDQIHFICPLCEYKFCLKCGVEWHDGSTCEKYQQWRKDNEKVDEKFEEMRRNKQIQTCPSCKHAVVKNHARECNRIMCTQCRINFCWICGQRIQGYQHFADKLGSCYQKLWEGVKQSIPNIPVPQMFPPVQHNRRRR